MAIKFLDQPSSAPSSQSGIAFTDGQPAPAPTPTPQQQSSAPSHPGGLLGFLAQTSPGHVAQDIMSNFMAGQDTQNANKVSSSVNDLNQALQTEISKTTDPARRQQLQAAIANNLGSTASTYNQVAQNPQYNRTTEQGLGDVAGTAADLFAGTTAAGKGIIPTLERIGIGSGAGGTFGLSQALQNNASAPDTVSNVLKATAYGAVIPTLFEGGGVVQGALKDALGKTALGKAWASGGNTNYWKGLLGAKEPTDYLNGIQNAVNSADEYDLGDARQAVQNILQKNFKVTPIQVEPQDLQTMQSFVNGQGVNTQQLYDLYDKYVTPLTSSKRDIIDELKDISGNSVRKYQQQAIPSTNNIQQTFQKIVDNNGNLGLDFSKSGIRVGSPEAKSIAQDYNTLMSLDNSTLSAIDGLKQQIGSGIERLPTNNSGQVASALMTQLKNAIQEPLMSNLDYAQAMKDYGAFATGKGFSSLLPKSIASKVEGGAIIPLIAAIAHNPALITGSAAASPIVQGVTLGTLGAGSQALQKATTPLISAAAQYPAASTPALLDLLRTIGLSPLPISPERTGYQ